MRGLTVLADDNDASNCTDEFVSLDVLTLSEQTLVQRSAQQLLLTRSVFTSDGFVSGWTVAAEFKDGQDSFPQLQIWRRAPDQSTVYIPVNSAELFADSESPNQLYSGTIDPPLPFQSGDVLGMFLPSNTSSRNASRLTAYFGGNMGANYRVAESNEPLQSIDTLDGSLGTDNLQLYLALEITSGKLSQNTDSTQIVQLEYEISFKDEQVTAFFPQHRSSTNFTDNWCNSSTIHNCCNSFLFNNSYYQPM